MGLCQLSKLRGMSINEDQINTVVEIARHIRDEASQKLDQAFDESAAQALANEVSETTTFSAIAGESCCTSTASGQACY